MTALNSKMNVTLHINLSLQEVKGEKKFICCRKWVKFILNWNFKFYLCVSMFWVYFVCKDEVLQTCHKLVLCKYHNEMTRMRCYKLVISSCFANIIMKWQGCCNLKKLFHIQKNAWKDDIRYLVTLNQCHI